MTDNLTTELLCKLLEERGVSCQTHYLHASWYFGSKLYDAMDNLDGTLTVSGLTPEQAIAATLGGEREKVLEFMLEAARDDLSRFIGNMNDMIQEEVRERLCRECAEDMGRYADSLCDPLKQRIAELEEQRDVLLRCLENDWNINASWDGLRRFWNIELTEEGVRLRDAELNIRGERTCHNTQSDFDFMCSECSKCVDNGRVLGINYCPNCGRRVVNGKESA